MSWPVQQQTGGPGGGGAQCDQHRCGGGGGPGGRSGSRPPPVPQREPLSPGRETGGAGGHGARSRRRRWWQLARIIRRSVPVCPIYREERTETGEDGEVGQLVDFSVSSRTKGPRLRTALSSGQLAGLGERGGTQTEFYNV